MSTVYQQVIERALALPPSERVALAETMLESVGENEVETIGPEEWEAAWKTEVKRRLQKVEQGSAKVYSWDDVDQRLIQKLNSAKMSGHD